MTAATPATRGVLSHGTWTEANARAQNSEREVTVPRPQSSAARRDLAQDVDERGRKGITLERRIKRFWAGRGSVRRDGRNARDARRSIAWDVDGNGRRAQRSNRELTVPRPQSSAAVRDFAQGVDENQLGRKTRKACRVRSHALRNVLPIRRDRPS